MSFIFIHSKICTLCLCVCISTLHKYPERHMLYSPLSSVFAAHTHTHTHRAGGLSGRWLMTVICQAEVDKTVNIIFVLRARAHRALPRLSFISGWTQRHAGTRRQPGGQQIYSHYFSIRTSAPTDQALHLYTDIRQRKRGGWRVERRGEEREKERTSIKARGNLTFLNLINTSLNHPIWEVIVQYSHGKWHLSALMLSFSVEINRFALLRPSGSEAGVKKKKKRTRA